MSKPLAIDLFCGLGGWTEGLLMEGYRVIGFDIEAHDYGDGKRYPSQLVLQDVRTLHGGQFKDAALIVASPPCQEFSYMAMPWSRAKAIADEYRKGLRDVQKLTELFRACFRIQREAIEVAGHFIPMVVENVRGAQPWVGRARWNYGSYYLWGDVPALMPITLSRPVLQHGIAHRPEGVTNFHGTKLPGNNSPRRWDEREVQRLSDAGVKTGDRNVGGKWTHSFSDSLKLVSESGTVTDVGSPARFTSRDCGIEKIGRQSEGVKGFTPSGEPLGKNVLARKHGSGSKVRKAASASIAKIPLPLGRWIGKVYHPC